MGAKSYKLIESLNISEGAVVEIGSERAEGSTTYLSTHCETKGIPFYTIDFNKDQYLNALRITNGVGAFNMTGEEFLSNIFPLLNQKISFVYLDNFDLVTGDGRDWTQRKSLYKSYGLEMSNINSKIAHMTQAILAEKYANQKCHILFDDTWIDSCSKQFEGKGAWAINPLIYAGFKIKNDVFEGAETEGLKNGYVLMSRE